MAFDAADITLPPPDAEVRYRERKKYDPTWKLLDIENMECTLAETIGSVGEEAYIARLAAVGIRTNLKGLDKNVIANRILTGEGESVISRQQTAADGAIQHHVPDDASRPGHADGSQINTSTGLNQAENEDHQREDEGNAKNQHQEQAEGPERAKQQETREQEEDRQQDQGREHERRQGEEEEEEEEEECDKNGEEGEEEEEEQDADPVLEPGALGSHRPCLHHLTN